MEKQCDIWQVAKSAATEQRAKDEAARKKLEESNSKFIEEADKIKNTLIAAATRLHGLSTNYGPIDVIVNDKQNAICFISVGGAKFCRIDVKFKTYPSKKEEYLGVGYFATIWEPDSDCDLNCPGSGWFGLSHKESCKVECFQYSGDWAIPGFLETIGYKLSKWL